MAIDWSKAGLFLPEVAEKAGIELVEVLHGHTSQETAYIQPDYPYGRTLRCKRRVWLERAEKGAAKGEFRLVTQTTNPKVVGREVWNKPHASVYTFWAVLLRYPDRREDGDFLGWTGVGINGPSPMVDVRMHVSGVYDGLNERERKMYDALLKLYEKRNPESMANWKEQLSAMRHYRAVNGIFPPDPTLTMATGKYVAEHEYPSVLATILLEDYLSTQERAATMPLERAWEERD